MIKITDLSKSFGRLQALKQVSFEATGGQCIALIGPNGCGKTTLLKSVLGMVKPDKGTITVNDKLVERDWQYRRSIGYMPQIGRYPQNMKIGQVLDMLIDLRQSQAPLDDELMTAFKMKDLLHKRMGTLSGGTVQKVSACIAFLFNPSILILDEPTAGLDPVASGILREKIQEEIARNRLIIITSHILSEMDGLVNRITYMHEGKILFDKENQSLIKDTGTSNLMDAVIGIMKANGI